MNTIRSFLVVVISVILVWTLTFFSSASAQVPEEPGILITPNLQYDYADQLFESGDYIAAQVEFKRFIHFFPDDPRIEQADYKTGLALFHSNQFYEAAKRFDRIIREAHTQENKYVQESYFMQSKAFEAMGNTGYAQLVLQNYLKLSNDVGVKDRIYLALARIHIKETMNLGKDDLDKAASYMTLISPENKDGYQVKRQLTSIENAQSAPSKNPTLAGVLAIIPGGGLLYCERYKDAFVSFCLNAGLMYAAYEAFNHDNPALGGVITFVGAGFYAGNIYGSVNAAHKYNKAAQVKILNQEFNLGSNFDPFNKSFMLTLNYGF